jgi:integrase/recombinase XerD
MDKLDFLVLKFTEHLKVCEYSDRSIPDYIRNTKFFIDFLRDLKIENIAEADRRVLADYQAKIYLDTYKGKPLTSATQKNRLTAVRTFFRYLLKTGQVLYDPSSDITMPKRPKLLPKNILTKKEIGELLSAPNLETHLGVRDRAILETFYSTGIRVSELCNLTLNDININEGELRVNKGKGQKDRVVPLGELACDYIEFYLRDARSKLTDSNQEILFVTKSGRKFRSTTLSYLISRYGKRSGISKSTSPHVLRHSCATHLLKGKADIRHIQQILGHSSIETTQRYTRVEITDLKQVLKRCHPRERREIETHDI